MRLTREQAIAEFRKMWNWIADETERRETDVAKYQYFEELKLDHVRANCYLCEYATDCCDCPIEFNEDYFDEDCPCDEEGSPYYDWYHADSWGEAAKYAREIANLPEKEV